jgi:hypothetical protein
MPLSLNPDLGLFRNTTPPGLPCFGFRGAFLGRRG